MFNLCIKKKINEKSNYIKWKEKELLNKTKRHEPAIIRLVCFAQGEFSVIHRRFNIIES